MLSVAQAEIHSEVVSYKIDGQPFQGYLSYDDAIRGKRPGVLVVHEWWGHNAYARKRADMLAKLGYTAFALDMYGAGKLAAHPQHFAIALPIRLTPCGAIAPNAMRNLAGRPPSLTMC